MSNDIFLIGEVGFEITLDSILEQIKKTNQEEPLNVHIHSGGGQVYDGLAIYNHLKTLPQGVNTFSSGLIASIASIIFLAGDRKTRTINKLDNFLIHLPSGGDWGTAEDLEKTAEHLRDLEEKMAGIYTAETDLTVKEAMDLMKEDKMLDVEFLKEKGIVAEIIEFKAVAKYDHKQKIDMSEQLTKKELTKELDSFWAKLKKIVNPKNNASNKIVQDANGVEIEFINLSETDTPKVDEEARIENAKASGDYVMPSGETYKFENGILTEIVEAEDEVEVLTAEVQTQKDLVKTLTTEKKDLDKKLKEKETAFTSISDDFKKLKASVTSAFEHNGTIDLKEDGTPKERQLFKAGREEK